MGWRNRHLIAVCCLPLGGVAGAEDLCSGAALPAGDAAYGAYLAAECSSCHGPQGAGAAGVPGIAGRTATAFSAALLGYRCGARAHAGMQVVAARLGPAEVAALAAYFEALEAE